MMQVNKGMISDEASHTGQEVDGLVHNPYKAAFYILVIEWIKQTRFNVSNIMLSRC